MEELIVSLTVALLRAAVPPSISLCQAAAPAGHSKYKRRPSSTTQLVPRPTTQCSAGAGRGGAGQQARDLLRWRRGVQSLAQLLCSRHGKSIIP